jgi:hypothetical protein
MDSSAALLHPLRRRSAVATAPGAASSRTTGCVAGALIEFTDFTDRSTDAIGCPGLQPAGRSECHTLIDVHLMLLAATGIA